MATIKLDGFPTGPATVTASENGSTAQQATGTYTAPLSPVEDAVYYGQTGVLSDRMRGVQYNMSSDHGNGTRFAGGYAPVRWTQRLDPANITAVAGNRIFSGFNILSDFDSYRSGFLVDQPDNPARARVYRAMNGVLQKVRESAITAYSINDWKPALAQGTTLGSGATRIITDTSYTVGFQNFNRPNSDAFFGVAAVDASGARWGAVSSGVSHTRPASITTTQSNGTTITANTSGWVEDPGFAAPTGVTTTPVGNGSGVTISWNPVAGASGYIIFFSDTDPAGHDGFYFDLADDGGAAVTTGDLIWVDKLITRPERDWISNRVYDVENAKAELRSVLLSPDVMPDDDPNIDWKLVRENPGNGSHALEVTLTNGASLTLGRPWASALDQSFYEAADPSQTYRFSIWLKASEPRTVTFNPDLKDGVNPGSSFNVTTDWQAFSFDFSPAAAQLSGGQVSTWKLPLTSGAGGATYTVAAPKLFIVDGVDRPYEMSAEDLARHGTVYGHRLQKNSLCGHRGFTIDGLTNPAGEGGTGSRKETRTGGASLPTQLNDALTTGATLCYVTLDPSLDETEVTQLMEYMFAPAGAGIWADKRVAEGRSTPWHTAFPRWRWEWCCEPWNQLFRPWSFVLTDQITDAVTGQVYAGGGYYQLWVNHLKSVMRASPHWTQDVEDRMEWTVGGFHTIPAWAEGAWDLVPAADTGLKTATGIAKYLAGWELGYGTPLQEPEGYYSILNFSSLRGQYVDTDLAVSNRVENGGNGHVMFTYEGGPGYNLNGLNGVVVTEQDEFEQERTTKSISGAAGNVSNYMVAWEAGFDDLNVFIFRSGSFWSTHAKWNFGGADYPFFQMLKLISEECVGELRQVAGLKVPVQFVPGQGGEPDVYDAPSVRAWQTRNGNRVCFIITSATLPFDAIDSGDPLFDPADDGIRDVCIQLPFASATSLTRYAFDEALDTNHAYNHHNVDVPGSDPLARAISIHQTSMPPEFPALHAVLSPAATHIYVFDGVS